MVGEEFAGGTVSVDSSDSVAKLSISTEVWDFTGDIAHSTCIYFELNVLFKLTW